MPSPTRFLTRLLLPAVLAPSLALADIYVVSQNPRVDTSGGSLFYKQDGTGCTQAVGSVSVGNEPVAIAVSPDNRRVYVTNRADGTLSVFDPQTRAVTTTVTLGGSILDVAASASRAYVTTATQVSIVDPVLATVVGGVRVANTPVRLALDTSGTRLYAALSGLSQLAVIDTTTNTVVRNVPLDAPAFDVVGSVDGSRIYVVLQESLVVLDAASFAVIATVPVPPLPASAPAGAFRAASAVAVHPDGTRVYVAVRAGRSGGAGELPGFLMVVSATSNAVLYTRDVGLGPIAVAVDSTRVAVPNGSEQLFDGSGPVQLTQSSVSYFDSRTDQSLGVELVGRSAYAAAAWSAPAPPPLPTGVQVTAIEVTQGIQDLANSVPLVAGRRTFVRAHVKVRDGTPDVSSTATLFVVRARGAGGLGVIDTPLGALEVINPGGRIWVRSAPRREVLNDSFLFELPRAWDILANDRLKFYVIPRVVGEPPPTQCRGDAPTTDTYFDMGTLLKMQFVRVSYDYDGTRLQATPAQQMASEAWIRAAFPLTTLASPNPALPPVYVAGLESRVKQTAPECGEDDAELNMCAHDYVVPQLALNAVVTGTLGDGDGVYALIPQAPDPALFTRGACCSANIGAGPAHIADYAAHEIGHLLDRDHPVEGASDLLCGHEGKDAAYPYALSLIRPPSQLGDPTGFAGFDTRRPNFAVHSTDTFDYDIMGYCKPSWISDYTYRGLYTRLKVLRLTELQSTKQGIRSAGRARARAVQTGDWLAVSGTIRAGASTAARFRALRVSEVAKIPERIAGDFSLRLLGTGGTVLADYPFTPTEAADAAGGVAKAFTFTQVVAFVTGTTQVQVVDLRGATRVIASKAVSASAPVVSSVTPQGAPDPATGRLTVNWTANDADADALTYDVLASRNGGTFIPLALGVTETTTVIDTSRLGGGATRVRVVANDGLLSGSADSASFTLPDASPEVTILSPVAPTTLVAGQPLSLEGKAADPQDGTVAESGLVWSAGTRTLGTGSNVTVADLPVGDHTVTLTATNSVGRSATATVRVNVQAFAADPGPRLAAGPVQLGWHVAAGATDTKSATITIINSGTGTLQFGAQSDAAWLSLDTNTGAAPSQIVLTARPAGLQSGKTYAAAVTLTVSGFPEQTLAIPVTLSIGKTFTVDSTPPPAVAPPTANAGADLAANEGVTVTLSAAQSTGMIARYEWRQVAGTAVTLQSASTATATFTAPRPSGTSEQLRFQLQVFDADGRSTTDEVVVTVSAATSPGGELPPVTTRRGGGGSTDLAGLLALLGLALRRFVRRRA